MVSVQNEKFMNSCQRATIMKRYAFLSSQNSAYFDRRTISVGQVVPEIPLTPPLSLSNFSADLHWSQGWPNFRENPRNSANPRKSLTCVKVVKMAKLVKVVKLVKGWKWQIGENWWKIRFVGYVYDPPPLGLFFGSYASILAIEIPYYSRIFSGPCRSTKDCSAL